MSEKQMERVLSNGRCFTHYSSLTTHHYTAD